jgi:hypothetical protein
MKLDEIVPWGRSFAEYRRMFNLDEENLNCFILGCGDGPASFNAQMTELGYRVVSVDPLYAYSAAEIRARIEDTYDLVVEQTRATAHRFVWREFSDVDELGAARLAAMQCFLQDYDAGLAARRYRPASLPRLPFADGTFGLALCSHLLFLYSDHLTLDFHLASLREILRVAKEVRIFPLLGLDGLPSPYVEPVRRTVESIGYRVELPPNWWTGRKNLVH